MSRFMSERHSALKAYVPGEQPKDMQYVKLNTNESPFPPSKAVIEAISGESERLQLYSDPECRDLIQTASKYYCVSKEQILMGNGSDEILNFAFLAFGDEKHPFVFPEITYGFYPVFANLNRVPYKTIPLKEDFGIAVSDYENIGANVIIANPNAPTGLILSVSQVEHIAKTNPENVVIVDEAYVDFGTESCISLIEKCDNLLVVRTFSKSYSMAGARLGFAIGSKGLISDLNTIKYSTNPYNVNRMTMAAGKAALEDAAYYMANCKIIEENRESTKKRLSELGFNFTDSKANFIFVSHPQLDGRKLYLKLKNMGILIRHFDVPKIEDYNRITIGTREQMDVLISAIEKIIKEGDCRENQ